MITQSILSFFSFLVTSMLQILPTGNVNEYGLPPSIVEAVQFIFDTAQRWETFFPIQDMFVAVLVVITAELILFGWKAGLFVYTMIRGN